MKHLSAILVLLLAGCVSATQKETAAHTVIDRKAQALAATEQWAQSQPHWVAPFEPFRIIGNLYYVGTEGLAVYLIAGEEGHVVIDGGMAGYEQIIIDNILALGFEVGDVDILLNTHAHFDHSGGLAKLREVSGAKIIASEGDLSALEGGIYLGSEGNEYYSAPPVKVDTIIPDRVLDFGGYVIPIHEDLDHTQILLSQSTPGHSRGCTSWRMTVKEAGEEYNVLIFCSASVAANGLVPEQYDGIVEDYRSTFAKTKDWAPDIFLSNHAEVFSMKETREKHKAGDPLAFVNRGAFQKYIAASERAFERALSEQSAAAGKD